MSTNPANPPAFPIINYGGGQLDSETDGMTLRDYFAAAAMPEIIAQGCAKPGSTWQDCVDASATLAYLIADAMLKARQ